MTAWSPLLLREKSKAGGGAVTVKVKVVVRVRPPPLPVTVMVEGPVGVDVVVTSVRVVVQVGVHAVRENVALAPAGSPEAEKETDRDFPESRVVVMVLEAVAPCTTDRLPPLAREKLKPGGLLCARVGIRIKHRAVRNRFRIALLPFRCLCAKLDDKRPLRRQRRALRSCNRRALFAMEDLHEALQAPFPLRSYPENPNNSDPLYSGLNWNSAATRVWSITW